MPYLLESIEEFIKNLQEKQTDPALMKKMEEDIFNKAAECPRCAKLEDECICQDRDNGSTLNVYRMAPGNKKDNRK
jgi:hypothetical protein